MRNDVRARLDQAAAAVVAKHPRAPIVGLVLGSGLGAFGDRLGLKIPYTEIPGIPIPSVAGHGASLCLGTLQGTEVACLQGRVHLYEGHPVDDVVFGVRLLVRLGCRAVLLTNAAGGIDPSFRPGDLMLIRDHLNLTGHNPLVGANDDALGPRFPDLGDAYDPRLADLAKGAARAAGVDLKEGVYAAMLGPSYETPAEIRMLRTLGAAAVGMSTVAEVIALRHAGARVGAVSCVTNLAAGLSKTPLSHEEVETVAGASAARLADVLGRWVPEVAREVSR